MRLFQALIVPIAIYASETWTLKTEDYQRLTVFENDCLRAMVGKTRMDKCKMVDIRRRLGENDNIVNKIKRRRLNWFGHVTRRDGDSFVKRAYKEEFEGKRRPGRPNKRWVDQIRQDLRIPILKAERCARDRNAWKSRISKECAKTSLSQSQVKLVPSSSSRCPRFQKSK